MIVDARGIAIGKTHTMALEAIAHGGVMVCYRHQFDQIRRIAQSYNKEPPRMMTHAQFASNKLKMDGVHSPIYIDNVEEVLKILARGNEIPRISLWSSNGVKVLTDELKENPFLKDIS